MNAQEVLHLLQGFGYPAKEYKGTVQIEMTPRNQNFEIGREEVHAALQYNFPKENIRQVDPWTIVITF